MKLNVSDRSRRLLRYARTMDLSQGAVVDVVEAEVGALVEAQLTRVDEGEAVRPEVEAELECIRDHQGVEAGEVEAEVDTVEAEEDDDLQNLAEIIAILGTCG